MADQGLRQFEAGVFLVDKPANVSSFQVVRRFRRIFRIKKVGHAGTLDPFATGLLIVCVGRPATRLISLFMEGEKEYLATLALGVETDTQDPEGKIVSRKTVGTISGAAVSRCLQEFVGRQLQTPPQYSALKHKGKPLYYYARRGIVIEKESREIDIKSLQRIDGDHDLGGDNSTLQLRVICSKGTYIRTLAADIGRRLGCGGHLRELRRVRSGGFEVNRALDWDDLCGDNAEKECLQRVIPVEEVCKLLQ